MRLLPQALRSSSRAPRADPALGGRKRPADGIDRAGMSSYPACLMIRRVLSGGEGMPLQAGQLLEIGVTSKRVAVEAIQRILCSRRGGGEE